jgi:hypothetical protein
MIAANMTNSCTIERREANNGFDLPEVLGHASPIRCRAEYRVAVKQNTLTDMTYWPVVIYFRDYRFLFNNDIGLSPLIIDDRITIDGDSRLYTVREINRITGFGGVVYGIEVRCL